MLLFFLACRIHLAAHELKKARYLVFLARRKPAGVNFKTIEDLFNFVLQLLAHCDLKEYPPKQGISKNKLKGGKGAAAAGAKGGRAAPPGREAADSKDQGKQPEEDKKMIQLFEAWLTSKVLMLGWDLKQLQQGLDKYRKKSYVHTKLVWVRRKSPEQLAEEAEERAKAELEREALAKRLMQG